MPVAYPCPARRRCQLRLSRQRTFGILPLSDLQSSFCLRYIRTSGFCLGCLKLLPTAPLFEGSSASCCVLISPQIGLIFCTDVHYQCVKRRTKFGDCQMIVAKDIDHASWHRCRNLAVLVKKRRPRCTQMRSASLET